jgi:hypothetical protein
MRLALVGFGLALTLCGCERRGNLRSGADYNPPPAPHVANPYYDPYMAYGSANVRWRPPVYDRRGTIVRPGSGDLPAASSALPPGVF